MNILKTPFIKKVEVLNKKIPYLVENELKRLGIDPINNLLFGDNLFANQIILASGETFDLIVYEGDNYVKKIHRGKNSMGAFDKSIWLTEHISKISQAKEGLKDTGIFAILLNDDNFTYAMEGKHGVPGLLDIFGEENKIVSIPFQSKTGSNDSKTNISTNHEYLVLFAKNIRKIKAKGLIKSEAEYKYTDKDGRRWKWENLSAASGGKDSRFTIVDPATGRKYLPPTNRFWGKSQERVLTLQKSGMIKFDKKAVYYKMYFDELKSLTLPLSSLGHVFLNGNGTKELKSTGKSFYKYPKTVLIVKVLLEQFVTNPNGRVLDITCGSGTTGHAVLEYNKEFGTYHSFVLVTNDPRQLNGVYNRLKVVAKDNEIDLSLSVFDIKLHNKCSLIEDTLQTLGDKSVDFLKFKYQTYNTKTQKDGILLSNNKIQVLYCKDGGRVQNGQKIETLLIGEEDQENSTKKLVIESNRTLKTRIFYSES